MHFVLMHLDALKNFDRKRLPEQHPNGMNAPLSLLAKAPTHKLPELIYWAPSPPFWGI